ncbi:nucleotide exchange factor GrpE [bacterium]|nr:nucleotide exchange factor GrpE [bacterium]
MSTDARPRAAAWWSKRKKDSAAEEQARQLSELALKIDFDSEHYYNLHSGPAGGPQSGAPDGGAVRPDLASEAWANLSTLTADLTRVRGELYRLTRGVEQLRMPAIEAIGLDKVAEQLRGLEMKLRPLSEVLNRSEEDARIKRMLKDLLDVVDALDRVFEMMERQPSSLSDGLIRGFRSVYDLLLSAMVKAGLKLMEVGDAFDPHQHLAMGTEPNPEKADGSISRVLLKGYTWNGQVFRTAQVAVVKNTQ